MRQEQITLIPHPPGVRKFKRKRQKKYNIKKRKEISLSTIQGTESSSPRHTKAAGCRIVNQSVAVIGTKRVDNRG